MGRPPPLIRAMPERKRFISIEVFPNLWLALFAILAMFNFLVHLFCFLFVYIFFVLRCWNWTIGPPNQSCLLISRWRNLAEMLEIVGIKCVISSTLRTSSHKSHLCLNTSTTPVTLSGKRHLWAADHFSLDRLEAEQSSIRMFSVVKEIWIFGKRQHTWAKNRVLPWM